MGVCNGEAIEWEVGKGGGAAGGDFNTEEFAKSALTSATARRLHEKLIKSWPVAAKRTVGELQPQDVANTAWAFATAKRLDERSARATEQLVVTSTRESAPSRH